MARPRALFVCGQIPALEAAQAGHKSAFKYLADLSKTHAIDLLIACNAIDMRMASPQMDELRPHVDTVSFVPISRMARAWGVMTGLLHGVAPRFASRFSKRVLSTFLDLVSRNQPQLVWLEFSQCFWLAEHVPTGTRTVLSAHDIQTQLVASKSSLELKLTLGLTFQCEKRYLDRADQVRVQSAKDAALLESFFRLPALKIEVIKPALSSFLDTLRRVREGIEPLSILFWGAMGRPENAEAIIEFATRDFQTLLARHPAAKLYVVGSSPTADVRALASPSITITGFLDDPSAYFERCSLGIAPIVSGAGVKVKVLEMLQAGIPVISTPVGAEGVAGNSLLTVVSRSAFADAITQAWQ